MAAFYVTKYLFMEVICRPKSWSRFWKAARHNSRALGMLVAAIAVCPDLTRTLDGRGSDA
jgi:hypothetical protein